MLLPQEGRLTEMTEIKVMVMRVITFKTWSPEWRQCWRHGSTRGPQCRAVPGLQVRAGNRTDLLLHRKIHQTAYVVFDFFASLRHLLVLSVRLVVSWAKAASPVSPSKRMIDPASLTSLSPECLSNYTQKPRQASLRVQIDSHIVQRHIPGGACKKVLVSAGLQSAETAEDWSSHYRPWSQTRGFNLDFHTEDVSHIGHDTPFASEHHRCSRVHEAESQCLQSGHWPPVSSNKFGLVCSTLLKRFHVTVKQNFSRFRNSFWTVDRFCESAIVAAKNKFKQLLPKGSSLGSGYVRIDTGCLFHVNLCESLSSAVASPFNIRQFHSFTVSASSRSWPYPNRWKPIKTAYSCQAAHDGLSTRVNDLYLCLSLRLSLSSCVSYLSMLSPSMVPRCWIHSVLVLMVEYAFETKLPAR